MTVTTNKKQAPSIEELQNVRDQAEAKRDAARAALDVAMIKLGGLENEHDELTGALNDDRIALQAARDSDARSHNRQAHARLAASQKRVNDASAKLAAFDSTQQLQAATDEAARLQTAYDGALSHWRESSIAHQTAVTNYSVRCVLTSFEQLTGVLAVHGQDAIKLDGDAWWPVARALDIGRDNWALFSDSPALKERRAELRTLIEKFS